MSDSVESEPLTLMSVLFMKGTNWRDWTQWRARTSRLPRTTW